MTRRHRVQVIPAPPLLPLTPAPDGYAHALILEQQAWVLGGQWLGPPDPYPPGQGPGPCGSYSPAAGHMVSGAAAAGPDCIVTLPTPPDGTVWVLFAYNTHAVDYYGDDDLIHTDPAQDWDAQLGGLNTAERANCRALGYSTGRTVVLTLRNTVNPSRPPQDPGAWTWIAVAVSGTLLGARNTNDLRTGATFTNGGVFRTTDQALLSAAFVPGTFSQAGSCTPLTPATVPGYRAWYATSPQAGDGVQIQVNWWEATPGTARTFGVGYTRQTLTPYVHILRTQLAPPLGGP